MANKVNIIVQVACKLIINPFSSTAGITYKLSFWHLVLDMWVEEVHREHDERETDHVDSICKQISKFYSDLSAQINVLGYSPTLESVYFQYKTNI